MFPGQVDDEEKVSESERNGTPAMKTLSHGKRFSRKLKRRLTQRTLIEARALKKQSKVAMNVLIYALELVNYIKFVTIYKKVGLCCAGDVDMVRQFHNSMFSIYLGEGDIEKFANFADITINGCPYLHVPRVLKVNYLPNRLLLIQKKLTRREMSCGNTCVKMSRKTKLAHKHSNN